MNAGGRLAFVGVVMCSGSSYVETGVRASVMLIRFTNGLLLLLRSAVVSVVVVCVLLLL